MWRYFFVFLCFHFSMLGAQTPSIEFGNTKIALNEPFILTIQIEGVEITDFSPFPEIKGMKKVGAPASATQTGFGSQKTTHLRTQTYHPLREGSCVIPPFKMRINGSIITTPEEVSVIVGKRDPRRPDLEDVSPEDLLGEAERQLIAVETDAFLSLSIDKTNVRVGEGFTVILALFVSEANQAPIQLLELGKQMESITRQLKPANCWEENLDLREIPPPTQLVINGKAYFQNKLYEATFFPLNAQPIQFSPVSLRLRVKRKIDVRNPNDFGNTADTELRDFATTPRTVFVQSLPPHPLRERVSVGSFALVEQLSAAIVRPGESFTYQFQITGEGNIAGLSEPELRIPETWDNYPPRVRQFIARGGGRVSGTAVFEYSFAIREPGRYALGDYFQWVYYNPLTARYDTLRPQTQVRVLGEELWRGTASTALHNFYRRLNTEIDGDISRGERTDRRITELGLVVLILAVAIFIIAPPRRKM